MRESYLKAAVGCQQLAAKAWEIEEASRVALAANRPAACAETPVK
jgi:hypothetical protein